MLGMSPDVPLAELDVTSRQYGPGRYARNCYAQHHSSTGCHHAGARAIRTEEARCLLSVCVCARVCETTKPKNQSPGKGAGLTFSGCSQLPGRVSECPCLSCEQNWGAGRARGGRRRRSIRAWEQETLRERGGEPRGHPLTSLSWRARPLPRVPWFSVGIQHRLQKMIENHVL